MYTAFVIFIVLMIVYVATSIPPLPQLRQQLVVVYPPIPGYVKSQPRQQQQKPAVATPVIRSEPTGNPLEPVCHGAVVELKARREHIRIPSLEMALLRKEVRVMVDIGSPNSHLSLFVATSPDAFVFSFGVETRMAHLLPKRRNWFINPPDASVIGPNVDYLVLQAWDAFMPVVKHVITQGHPRIIAVMPLGPQCHDLRPLLGEYRCVAQIKFVQCERL